MDVRTALELLVFMLPAYVANSIPVVLGGGAKLDLGNNFSDGRRMFGDGKTIRGFLAGVFGGICAGGAITLTYLSPYFPSAQMQFAGFCAMAFGTMVGDALGSFVKRRAGVDAGKPFILDQLMFIVVALLAAVPFVSSEVYAWDGLLFMLLATYVLHVSTNFIANRLGWKKVPW